ncbi:MAG: hypothetical protein P8J87_21125 [Verrucomicrobiales bacterium]|nr:hypothetical protein [Verrucomicrobiales bacterium]
MRTIKRCRIRSAHRLRAVYDHDPHAVGYTATTKLAGRFNANFQKYADGVSPEVDAACPVCRRNQKKPPT